MRNRLVPVPEVVTALPDAAPRAAAPLDAALRAYLEDRLAERHCGASVRRYRAAGASPVQRSRLSTRRASSFAAGCAISRAFRAKLGEAAQLSFAAAPVHGSRSCAPGALATCRQSLTMVRDGPPLTGYPRWSTTSDSVSLALFDTPETAEASTAQA